MPLASKYCQLLADGEPVGDITSQSLSGRYDAWMGFVYFESDLIERLKNESVSLQLLCNNEFFEAVFSELPFKLEHMGLQDRVTNQ